MPSTLDFLTLKDLKNMCGSLQPLTDSAYKRNKDRRRGNGRHFGLGGGGENLFNSLPCYSYFAQNDFEEQDKLILIFQIILAQSWCNHPIIQNRPRQNSWRGNELNTIFPPNRSNNRSLPFLLSLSFFYSMRLRKLLCPKCFDNTLGRGFPYPLDKQHTQLVDRTGGGNASLLRMEPIVAI